MRRSRLSPFVSGLIASAVMLTAITGVILNGLPVSPLSSLPWNHPSILKVELADADALAPHASVEIAGVKVGEVRSVEADGTMALATLAIDPRYFDVHGDAQIKLRPHGLFGPKYIDILPGTTGAPQLHDGDTIRVQHTVQPVDLDQILQALQAPEQQDLRTTLVELGKAAAGRGDDANHLIAAADSLSLALDTPVRALDNVDTNLSDMLIQDEAFNSSFSQVPLDQLVANNAQIMQAFAANSDHLQSLLDHANSVLANLDQSLNGQGGDIRAILETAPGTIDRLDQFNNLLGIFAANLTGKDPSVPHDSNVTQGIISAIENPKSAFSSYDPCTPGQNHCGPDGRDYYLRVQVFNEGGSGNSTSSGAFPVCLLSILNAPPGTPPKVNCPSSTTSSSIGGSQVASDYGSLASMLAA